jgi:hypothetical protein
MPGPLARRATSVVGALALLATVMIVPPVASAQSLFQGALDPIAPLPSPSPSPSLTASQLALSSPTPVPTPVVPLRPDIKVMSLGVIRGVGGSDAYAFRVQNVGQGGAAEVKLTRQVVVKRTSDKTWVRTEVHTTNDGPLKPGQELTVEVPCSATDRQYCDVGGVLADVVGPTEDADTANNYIPTFENIK